MNEDAARFTGSIPENYDTGLGPHIFAGYAADLARRIAALAPHSVLELAAGTGIVTRQLRDALDDGCMLVASDLNAPMLDVAKAKFGAEEAVRFEVVDATSMPYGDGEFDAVACQFGVMFFPDKARSYAEALRVLKPGGSYLFNVWGPLEDNPFAQIAHDVISGFFPDDPPQFYKIPFGYNDAAAIERALTAAGFSRARSEHVPLTAAIRSPQTFARGLVRGNPAFEEIVARGGDADAVVAALAEAIASRLGGEMPLSALLFHASK